jgi:hypothetical protein
MRRFIHYLNGKGEYRMALILPGILPLVHHMQVIQNVPESYRPEKCPNCEKANPWYHGYYTRKADRSDMDESMGPIPIPRFFCSGCRATCSVLPECIPPRGWYPWEVQQIIFLLLLAGTSINRAKAQSGSRVCRQTICRWWRQFKERFPLYSFHLLTYFPWLGRYSGFTDFWRACLDMMALSRCMFILNSGGVCVPPYDFAKESQDAG